VGLNNWRGRISTRVAHGERARLGINENYRFYLVGQTQNNRFRTVQKTQVTRLEFFFVLYEDKKKREKKTKTKKGNHIQ